MSMGSTMGALNGLGDECGEDGMASSSRVLRRFSVTLFEFGVVGGLAAEARVGVVGKIASCSCEGGGEEDIMAAVVLDSGSSLSIL